MTPMPVVQSVYQNWISSHRKSFFQTHCFPPTGSHGVEVALDKAKKRHDYVPSYVSPWEKAMKGNQELTSSMRYHMPVPHAHLDLPKYKSFNRYSPLYALPG